MQTESGVLYPRAGYREGTQQASPEVMNKVGSGCYSQAGKVMSEAGGRKWLEDMIFREEHADYRCKLFPTFTHPTQSTVLSALGNTRWVGGWMSQSVPQNSSGSWSALGVPLCESKR